MKNYTPVQLQQIVNGALLDQKETKKFMIMMSTGMLYVLLKDEVLEEDYRFINNCIQLMGLYGKDDETGKDLSDDDILDKWFIGGAAEDYVNSFKE